jgi:nucleotide-binding universal stress UspA family protein
VNLLEEKLESLGTDVAIKNILFATDFSIVSEAALPYVTALSLRYGSMVHVAHVLPNVTLLRPGAPDPTVFGSIYEDAHSNAQEKMQALSMRLRGYPHRTYVRHGKVSQVVGDLIHDHEIDLLVLGTHGRTGLGRLIMGSIAEELFRQTRCPVLTVGPRIPAPQVLVSRHHPGLPPMQVKFRQILYATDLKPDAAPGASYAVALSREFQARLTLLHVIDGFGEDLHQHPGPIEVALRKLEELVPDREVFRHRPEFIAEFGNPAEIILQTAGEYEADLILLGVRPAFGRLPTATHLGYSTTHRVIVGANCPVLTLRS